MVLTVGIPTFNSITTLKETLQSIQNQSINLKENRIEILISDNRSSFNIARELSLIFPTEFYESLRINVNESNKGYDYNLVKLMELSSGKYVKLLADDDILEKTYLENLIYNIHAKNFDILINNFAFMSPSLDSIIVPSWFSSIEFENFDKQIGFFTAINHAYGQVSSLTFRRDLISNLKVPKSTSNYIHVYWFLSLFEEFEIMLETKVLLKVRQGSPNFSGDGIVDKIIPLGGIKAIIDANLLNINLKKQLIIEQKLYCLQQLSSLSNQSLFARFVIARKFVKYFRFSSKFWLFWLPFLLMPNVLRKIFKKIRKSIIALKKFVFEK
jgi:glycosyltransferase involved in cell wall biosynthesis